MTPIGALDYGKMRSYEYEVSLVYSEVNRRCYVEMH